MNRNYHNNRGYNEREEREYGGRMRQGEGIDNEVDERAEREQLNQEEFAEGGRFRVRQMSWRMSSRRRSMMSKKREVRLAINKMDNLLKLIYNSRVK